jgi:GT2 family glycosyltransferase
MTAPASIVIPTRARLAYLEVALSSIAPEAARLAVEVLVVDDAGPSQTARELAERFGARYEPHAHPLGLNVARNTGVERSAGELVVFVDDDVRVGAGWLEALLDAAAEHHDVDVFTGPIRARLEGSGEWGSRSCGRERPPITTLELGEHDTDADYAWGANMAIRRAALERVGPFDVSLEHGGDEQEWQERLRSLTPGARVMYIAGASVEHRRAGSDARLRSLARASYIRGRAARRFDAWRGQAPSLGAELLTLGGCIGHVVRRRCPAGLTMVAHSWGRLRETSRQHGIRASRPVGSRPVGSHPVSSPPVGSHPLGSPPVGNLSRENVPRGIITVENDLGARNTEETPNLGARNTEETPNLGARNTEETPNLGARNTDGTSKVRATSERAPDDDFLSGVSGTVGGFDAVRREVLDEALDAWQFLSASRLRLGLAARHAPPLRRVLALGVERPERRELAAAMRTELLSSRHDVELHTCAPGTRGKFENLNLLLAAQVGVTGATGAPMPNHDWLLVVDDDVELPHGFLDGFLFLCERFSLTLAQPAHRLNSHAAWPVTRRRAGSAVRETSFVEIGPVTAFARRAFPVLLPFPELRMGWGLDVHWAALAREYGWRCGVVDALAIGHRVAPAAAGYARADAVAEARSFLAERPYLSAREADRTLTTHRGW